jgi:AcrR family transcriptional regulator
LFEEIHAVTVKFASRQEPRRLRTRAALLASGAELLGQRPIDAIAINEIVEHAGVAKGSFFNHFADKDDFAGAVAEEIRARVEEQVAAINQGVTDPALRLARGVARFALFARADRSAARIMLRGHARGLHADHPLNAGLRADIAGGIASGRFDAIGEDAAITFVIGVCQMLLAVEIEPDRAAADMNALTIEVLTLLLASLGIARPEAASLAARGVEAILG